MKYRNSIIIKQVHIYLVGSEILHYMISCSMLKEYNKIKELKKIANYITEKKFY